MNKRHNVHATGILLDGKGLLLRGPSGSGKSLLALSLLERWNARGLKSHLVSDDRVDLAVERGALTMYAPPAIAGLIELRGRGIVARPHAARGRVHLVVDLVAKLERLVEEEDLATELVGLRLPRCPVPRFGVTEIEHQALLVTEALRALPATALGARRKST